MLPSSAWTKIPYCVDLSGAQFVRTIHLGASYTGIYASRAMQSGKKKIAAAGGGVGLLSGIALFSFTLNSFSGPGSVSGSIVDVSIFKTDVAIAPVEQPQDAELLQKLDREHELLLAQERRLEN